MTALSSGNLAASLPQAMVDDVAGFLERASLPPEAGCPTGAEFPWPVVDRVEWMLRRAKAAQVRSWAALVHAAVTGSGNDDSNEDGDGGEQRMLKQVADRLAVGFTQTPQRTTSDLRAALTLVDHLPKVFALFEQGRLDWDRARLIAMRLLHAPASIPDFTPGRPSWRFIEDAMSVQAPALARPRLENLLNTLLLQLTPAGAHEAARARRRVWVEPLDDGMAFFGAILPADGAQYLMGVIEAMADACRDQAEADGSPDLRTHMQRCVDALIAFFTRLAQGGDIPIIPTPTGPKDVEDTAPAPAASRTRSTDGGTSNGKRDNRNRTGTPGSTATNSGTGTGTGTGSPDNHTPASPHPTTDAGTPTPEPAQDVAPASTPFPHPEDLITAKNGSLIPAWWHFRDLPRRKGHGPHLVITSTDATWLGLSNTPALLHGHGAIPADLARKIGADPDRVTILVFPTTNQPSTRPEKQEEKCAYNQDHTAERATRYRPTRTVSDLVTALYGTCTFPGCGRASIRCDLDHLEPFGKGGPSCICKQIPC